MDHCSFFLVFFRCDNSFQIIARDFVSFEDEQYEKWGPDDFMMNSTKQIFVQVNLENGTFSGVILQVAASAEDLTGSMMKAKDLR